MKKVILIPILLVGVLCFGQTKKKKETKKAEQKIVVKQDLKSNNISKFDRETLHSDSVAVPEEAENDNRIYTTDVEIKPQFPDGEAKMIYFLNSKFTISNEMKSNNVNGKIITQFVVEKDGSLSDIKVIRDIGFGTKEEIVNVLKIMPKWISANHNGRNVRCLYILSYSINATN